MVEVGQKAPDIELYDSDKRPVRVSDLRGRRTVLAFYPGAFTGTCTKEMCSFRDNLSKFNALDANVVGISVDPPFSNRAWKIQNQLNFPLWSDYNRNAVNAYGIAHENFSKMEGYTASKRSVFVLDSEGIIMFKWVSEDPTVEPNYDEVLEEVRKVP